MTIGPSDGMVRAAARVRGRHPPRPHQGGVGLTGFVGVLMPSTTAYTTVEAARDLIVTNYRL
jgi:hypothetical protein